MTLVDYSTEVLAPGSTSACALWHGREGAGFGVGWQAWWRQGKYWLPQKAPKLATSPAMQAVGAPHPMQPGLGSLPERHLPSGPSCCQGKRSSHAPSTPCPASPPTTHAMLVCSGRTAWACTCAQQQQGVGRCTCRAGLGMASVLRRSSVRSSSFPLNASCMRQPRPQASTAHGGDCFTTCPSVLCSSGRCRERSGRLSCEHKGRKAGGVVSGGWGVNGEGWPGVRCGEEAEGLKGEH